ncbi:MAG TPA: hypothetical protein VKB88_09600 [Bryobacteraceae bacterium]|nr:hypothetical protein [Bryobacteraceae bacterium]
MTPVRTRAGTACGPTSSSGDTGIWEFSISWRWNHPEDNGQPWTELATMVGQSYIGQIRPSMKPDAVTSPGGFIEL